MSQPSLFEDGEALKRQGIAQVLANTREEYKSLYIGTVRSFVSGTTFTSETVTDIIGFPPGHPSAIGALTNTVASLGLCIKTGERVKSKAPRSHKATLEVWMRT